MFLANLQECEDYNLTSQPEEAEDRMVGKKRKISKRKFDNFVVDFDDMEQGEEESRMGGKLPPFPKPPTKLQLVQNNTAGSNVNLTSPRHATPKRIRDPKPRDIDRHSSSSRHSHVSGHSDRSQHSNGSWYREQSRHNDGSRLGYRSRHSDDSRHDHVGSSGGSRHDVMRPRDSANAVVAGTEDNFPMATAKFQKKVLAKLIDIHLEIKSLHQREPALSATRIERLETMEDFQRVEQHMGDKEAFETLVQQLSRVGGKDLKDCVHKVLDRLFSNSLMACFNMKGKGKKDKISLEKTTIYQAIQDAVLKSFTEATEDAVRRHAAEHLKHAPARRGGGGHAH
nr:uncharacterized protein LOC111841793 [Paramormyrops kingsleyae]